MVLPAECSTHSGCDSAYTLNRTLTTLALGGAIVGAGIIFAPTILTSIGIGDPAMAQESMFVLHAGADAGGTGLAGILNNVVASIPVVGDTLAKGGILNAVATGITGIGGVLLGNYLIHNAKSENGVRLGKLTKYAALATSALIALPTVLTGLSAGLIFLSTVVADYTTTQKVITAVDSILGAGGGIEHEFIGFTGSGIAAALPHLFTCGISIVPAGISAYMASKEVEPKHAAVHNEENLLKNNHYLDKILENGPPLSAIEKLKNATKSGLANGRVL